jgi:hypothetical protein
MFETMQAYFMYILLNIKHSNYNCISEKVQTRFLPRKLLRLKERKAIDFILLNITLN